VAGKRRREMGGRRKAFGFGSSNELSGHRRRPGHSLLGKYRDSCKSDLAVDAL
jgi:hypothetical protein